MGASDQPLSAFLRALEEAPVAEFLLRHARAGDGFANFVGRRHEHGVIVEQPVNEFICGVFTAIGENELIAELAFIIRIDFVDMVQEGGEHSHVIQLANGIIHNQVALPLFSCKIPPAVDRGGVKQCGIVEPLIELHIEGHGVLEVILVCDGVYDIHRVIIVEYALGYLLRVNGAVQILAVDYVRVANAGVIFTGDFFHQLVGGNVISVADDAGILRFKAFLDFYTAAGNGIEGDFTFLS